MSLWVKINVIKSDEPPLRSSGVCFPSRRGSHSLSQCSFFNRLSWVCIGEYAWQADLLAHRFEGLILLSPEAGVGVKICLFS